jgi:hypothetical protein
MKPMSPPTYVVSFCTRHGCSIIRPQIFKRATNEGDNKANESFRKSLESRQRPDAPVSGHVREESNPPRLVDCRNLSSSTAQDSDHHHLQGHVFALHSDPMTLGPHLTWTSMSVAFSNSYPARDKCGSRHPWRAPQRIRGSNGGEDRISPPGKALTRSPHLLKPTTPILPSVTRASWNSRPSSSHEAALLVPGEGCWWWRRW